MSDRIYSEDEIRNLMRRAAELQRNAPDERTPGLTVAEMEHAAAEAGIAPEFLRAALRESAFGVRAHDASGQTKTHVWVERVVPGELSEVDWENVVIFLRRRYGSDLGAMVGNEMFGTGTTEQIGSMRTWRHTSGLGVTSEFSVRTIDGAQHVRFERRVGLASPRVEGIGYGAVFALVAAGILAGVLQSATAFVVGFFAMLAVAAPTVEVLDRRWRARLLRDVNNAVSAVAGMLVEPGVDARVPDRDAAAEFPVHGGVVSPAQTDGAAREADPVRPRLEIEESTVFGDPDVRDSEMTLRNERQVTK